MSKNESRKKLAGPWRSLHAAVWLIGLAILFWTNWRWPGILVLVAISGIIEALIKRYIPSAVEMEEPAAISFHSSRDICTTANSNTPASIAPGASPGAVAIDLSGLRRTHPRA